MRALVTGTAAVAVVATGLLAPAVAQADPATTRAKSTLSTPWAAECDVPECWNIRISSIPRKLTKGQTFTVRLESRLVKATTRVGDLMQLVFLNVTAPDYSVTPSIEMIDVTVIRDGKRLSGSGSCSQEFVRDPVSGGDRPATVCRTSNPESRIWKGKETRVVRLKYLGGTFGTVPAGVSLSPGVFLQGLAQTTNLPTKQVRVRYGR